MPNFQCHLRSSFCAGEIFSFSAAPTQAPQNFEKCSKSRTLFQGDCPRLPRSLSWKKSRALRRVWHKPERMLEARAFFVFPETKESKTTEGYVPPSRFVFRLLKSSIACVCNRYGLLSIHHASGGTESRSYPYGCVDLSDIPDRNLTLDIVNKITPKRSVAIRRAHIPNQFKILGPVGK